MNIILHCGAVSQRAISLWAVLKSCAIALSCLDDERPEIASSFRTYGAFDRYE